MSRNFDSSVITLSDKDWDSCTNCVRNVFSDISIKNIIHPINDFGIEIPSFNEDVIFLDVLVTYRKRFTILKLKMKADN